MLIVTELFPDLQVVRGSYGGLADGRSCGCILSLAAAEEWLREHRAEYDDDDALRHDVAHRDGCYDPDSTDPVLSAIAWRRNDLTPVDELRSWVVATIPRLLDTRGGDGTGHRLLRAMFRAFVRRVAELSPPGEFEVFDEPGDYAATPEITPESPIRPRLVRFGTRFRRYSHVGRPYSHEFVADLLPACFDPLLPDRLSVVDAMLEAALGELGR